MDAFFTGLTKRQAMLLLTTVTFGDREGVEAFDHLPDDEGDVLRDRAKQILAIPRDKRIPFLVQEIKRFITGKKVDDLRAVDPARLGEALAPERPAMIEVILRALPSTLANEVRTSMLQKRVQLTKEVRPDVLAVIRWKFEERLKEILPERPGFSMPDLLVLAPRDVAHLADVMGAKALGPTLAGLPAAERDAFLQALSPDQRQLAARAATASATRKLGEADARAVLAELAEGAEPRIAIRNAGVRRLARAAVAESGEFASRLIERHHSDFGRALARFVSEERQAGRKGEASARTETLAELDRLAASGIVERPVRLPPPPMRPRAAPPSSQEVQPRGQGFERGLQSSPSIAPVRKPSPGGAPQGKSALTQPIQRGGAAASKPAERSAEDTSLHPRPGSRPPPRPPPRVRPPPDDRDDE